MLRLSGFICLGLMSSAGSLCAQVVQLPTFQFFGTSTTVSVPDHGTALLGGNTSAFSGSSYRGTPLLGPAGPLFNNRGLARGSSSSNIHVTAQIHDFDAMDRALLGGLSADEFRQQVRNDASYASSSGNVLPSRLTLGPANPPGRTTTVTSGASYSEQEIAAQLKRQQQAAQQLEMGQAMAARGKISLAQSYYRMALNNANGELRTTVLQAQAELSNTAAAPAAERK